MLVGCSMVCALVYAVLALFGERTLPVAGPVTMLLSRWFWIRHRLWGAGAVAALTGSGVLFALLDELRPHLDQPLADTVATEAGTVVALVVFTTCSRLRSAWHARQAR